jgi:hypothetical protein
MCRPGRPGRPVRTAPVDAVRRNLEAEHHQLGDIDERVGQRVGLVAAQHPAEDAAEQVEQ